MKIAFLVQGEGRGHMTQAISLSQILRKAGHHVVAVLVGKATDRTIPSFFKEQIKAPVHDFIAPNIVYNQCGAGMNVGRTLYSLLRNSPQYLAGLKSIHATINEVRPDLIISFYETYSGLYNVIFRPGTPMLCIAHQYLLLHPKFTFPKNKTLDRILINLNSKAASWLASKRLALSFREMDGVLKQKISVVPPLLRREVLDLNPSAGDFFLVYMTHHSLSKQIIEWHLAHPGISLHCFWDNPNVSDEFTFDNTLTFHRINSEKYLEKLASCKALVTTAGFESVCEAMYLGKPVMMVPVPNHFEQECNAIDGVISGAGVMSETFDLSILLEYLPKHQNQTAKFRNWYHKGESMFLNEVAAAGKKQALIQKSRAITISAQRIFNSLF
jgi:uncharacterized protein (TIGR00661 family)